MQPYGVGVLRVTVGAACDASCVLAWLHHTQHPQGDNVIHKGSLKETLLLAIPSTFDLIATVLMNVGLLSVTASVYQMMRGAEMLFAALFAVLFLKRHLNKYHYMGISCCVVSDGQGMGGAAGRAGGCAAWE